MAPAPTRVLPRGAPYGDVRVRPLLGAGSGTCLEIGCGTGVHAALVRELGWTPVGIGVSSGMLRHATGRLPVARADATRLPFADATLDTAISVMVHTDMPACSAPAPTGPCPPS